MPAGTVQSYTAAFNSMNRTIRWEYCCIFMNCMWMGKVDTKTNQNTFQIKPTVTATASSHIPNLKAVGIAGEIGYWRNRGCTWYQVTKRFSTCYLTGWVPDGVGFKEASDRSRSQRDRKRCNTFEDGVLTLPRYYDNREIPIFTDTRGSQKNPLQPDPKGTEIQNRLKCSPSCNTMWAVPTNPETIITPPSKRTLARANSQWYVWPVLVNWRFRILVHRIAQNNRSHNLRWFHPAITHGSVQNMPQRFDRDGCPSGW